MVRWTCHITTISLDLVFGSEKRRLNTGILNQMRQKIRMDVKDYS